MVGENGVDEWDVCLVECMCVFKLGGYIEFNFLDVDIINVGELGNVKVVEFGFVLQILGYDVCLIKNFILRFDKVGFEDVRRVWVVMFVGFKKLFKLVVSVGWDEVGGEEREVFWMEVVVSGLSDNIVVVMGLVVGWSWEKWLLRVEMERVVGELRLVDMVMFGKVMKEVGKMIVDVSVVVEEGRVKGSLFRCLKGYVRKLVFKFKVEFVDELNELDWSGSIRICLDIESLY